MLTLKRPKDANAKTRGQKPADIEIKSQRVNSKSRKLRHKGQVLKLNQEILD